MRNYRPVLSRAIAILSLALGSYSASAAVPVLDPALTSTLDSQGWVRVIVIFGDGQGRPQENAFDSKLPDAKQVEQIKILREQILAETRGRVVVKREFQLIPGFAAEIDQAALEWLQSHPQVERIDLDVAGGAHMAEGGPLANIPDVHTAGLTGAGLKIAVVDSGIDTDHPDFAGRIVAQQCMCSGEEGSIGCCPNNQETQSGAGAAEDGNGHGTNVSGIAAGGGAVALKGGAPGASIVAVRVLADDNSFCCLSDVVAGFDWVRVNHPDTRVLNASLGTFSLFEGSCDSISPSMTAAVNNLVANDTMVFVSSGNQGSGSSMAIPACISQSTSVGAVWDAERPETSVLGCTDSDIAAGKPTCFTNSNDTLDLYAPGAPIESSGNGGATSTYFGTSMSSPMTAGCIASLRAWRPDVSIAELEAVLKASPVTVTDPKNNLTFPLLDCLDAKNRLDAVPLPHFADGFEL